ncbi:restriction endonuclease subunit S, partial [Salmonella enterica subsp. enterica serovar Orion]
NQTHISSLPIPLPPYNEQERINSRINNLFIILEGLRTNLKSAQQTQLHLADALTDAAIN